MERRSNLTRYPSTPRLRKPKPAPAPKKKSGGGAAPKPSLPWDKKGTYNLGTGIYTSPEGVKQSMSYEYVPAGTTIEEFQPKTSGTSISPDAMMTTQEGVQPVYDVWGAQTMAGGQGTAMAAPAGTTAGTWGTGGQPAGQFASKAWEQLKRLESPFRDAEGKELKIQSGVAPFGPGKVLQGIRGVAGIVIS